MSPQEFWRVFDFKASQQQPGEGPANMPRAEFDELVAHLNDPEWGKPDAVRR